MFLSPSRHLKMSDSLTASATTGSASVDVASTDVAFLAQKDELTPEEMAKLAIASVRKQGSESIRFNCRVWDGSRYIETPVHGVFVMSILKSSPLYKPPGEIRNVTPEYTAARSRVEERGYYDDSDGVTNIFCLTYCVGGETHVTHTYRDVNTAEKLLKILEEHVLNRMKIGDEEYFHG